MAKLRLNAELLDFLVIGGSFYGGGGGGSPESGRELGLLALNMGTPYLVDVSDMPDDALLLTVSAVGAPAAEGAHVLPRDYVKAIELFQRHTGKRVSGFIANECGGLATVNGWVQSAATGLPVVDAPCNGRAHPSGVMGSMGLHLVDGYVSEQVAVGGSREKGTYLETFIQGSVESASGLVRRASVQAGGLVAVARNPVTAAYAKEHAAPGAIRRCLSVGRSILSARKRSAKAGVDAAARVSGGNVLRRGKVVHKELATSGGFDIGKVVVDGPVVGQAAAPAPLELVFCNEYVTLEALVQAAERTADTARTASGPVRLATFPDLITTMDLSTGLPVSSAEIAVGQEIAVVTVPRSSVILGAGMADRRLYEDVERATGKEIARYASG